MARIELVNLHKSFGAVAAVRNLNMSIEDGEFVVFVGPSGCGKTTTLRMIAGFEDPTSGEIRIGGQVVMTWSRATAGSAWCSRATRCFRTRTSRRTSSSVYA